MSHKYEMDRTIKSFKKQLKAVEKFCKDNGIKIDAYDIAFIDGCVVQLHWNPKYHIMPAKHEETFAGEHFEYYMTSIQLNAHDNGECHTSSTSGCQKEKVLERLRNTRKDELLDYYESLLPHDKEYFEGYRLYFLVGHRSICPIVCKKIKFDAEEHQAEIEGGEYDGKTIHAVKGYWVREAYFIGDEAKEIYGHRRPSRIIKTRNGHKVWYTLD